MQRGLPFLPQASGLTMCGGAPLPDRATDTSAARATRVPAIRHPLACRTACGDEFAEVRPVETSQDPHVWAIETNHTPTGMTR